MADGGCGLFREFSTVRSIGHETGHETGHEIGHEIGPDISNEVGQDAAIIAKWRIAEPFSGAPALASLPPR
jgi:hypothetical protein